MQTLKSIYRIVVMGTTLAIIVMGWRLYGPTAAQSKTMALQGIEWVQSALRPNDASNGDAAVSSTANLQPVAPANTPAAASQTSVPPLLFSAEPNVFPRQTENSLAVAASSDEINPAGHVASTDAPLGGEGDMQIKTMLSRLVELNVNEPTVVPWGANGEFYRCSCRATWANSPQLGRHFESVAAEPAKAIEQVVAQVSRWRQGDPATR
jgi:hypothetical protein